MTIEPAPDRLIDRLVADLVIVTPPRPMRDAWRVAALVVAEMLVFGLWRGANPDLPWLLESPAFWWKLLGFGLIGTASVLFLLASLDPALTMARRQASLWRATAITAAGVMAVGWRIDAAIPGTSELSARLEWREGLDCLANILLLALPLLLALGLLVQRGAPTRPGRTAVAAGLGAAGLATFVFALHCPHLDVVYIAAWYGGAVLVVAGLARLLLPRLARW
ncbi:NrsF family protein [Polymorphobacter fuscus]|uniref:DUF1109 family protein n=1 Tax=Sandarakinorhabdus fusca TaxID=1439888 RepID=A0A7C9KWD4_9SPHN|nr:NrsF family protein [Polymorphobacter fuscus]KAB7647612.1 DUF1109 domain-containing protein [Polymorphobacter fuscus]MQT16885.1 DUF1109 family protein [Polymorphobacter fuscus]NJC09126.1 hypothetical protein [Polymorphobacter fuscus]